jgi:hypothetical protein
VVDRRAADRRRLATRGCGGWPAGWAALGALGRSPGPGGRDGLNTAGAGLLGHWAKAKLLRIPEILYMFRNFFRERTVTHQKPNEQPTQPMKC